MRRRLGLLSAFSAAIVVVAAGADRARTAAAAEPVLGFYQLPNSAVVLARLDPLTLKPVSARVRIGEYHSAWSLSPDGTQLAVAVSAPGPHTRIGVEIVDLTQMRIVQQIETGIAAEALDWLAPHLLAADLQRGGTVLVDPATSTVVQRWTHPSSERAWAATREAFVVVYRDRVRAGQKGRPAARMVVVDVDGRIRSVALRSTRIARPDTFTHDVGLAVDPTSEHAYVFAADDPVAAVDLRTLAVTYHRVPRLLLSARARRAHVDVRKRRALWLGNGRVLVVGNDLVYSPDVSGWSATAAGATIVDTSTWRSRTLDRRAGAAVTGAGTLLVYAPGLQIPRSSPRPGLVGYTAGGRKRFELFRGQQVWDVRVAGGRAYVRTPRAVRIVDPAAGKVVHVIAPPVDLVDVVTP